jgi:putative nucleotidyltransferase with HDIG domain
MSMQTLSPREELLATAETLKVLPTLSAIIDEVLRILADDNSSFHTLFNVVRYDQAISSKVISIANSAYFNRGAQIVHLERAMVSIGFDEIRRIVMCLVFLKEMLGRWKLSNEDLASLWGHTLAVACAAKILAEKTMMEDREKVFTVSILHDLGKVPLFLYGDRYRKLREEAHTTGRDICSMEREAFGIDHAELGHFIAVKWRFPEEFAAVILKHHNGTENEVPLIDIVMKADIFTDRPDVYLGPAGAILQEEVDRIKAETKRVAGLLGVS